MLLRCTLCATIVLGCSMARATAQTTWTGGTDTNWQTAGNWSAGIPTASTDVVINAAANQPSTYTANPVCRNLTINAGAILTLVSGYDLTASGSVTINASGTLALGPANIRVAGSWTSLAANALATGTGTVEFTGPGTTYTASNTIPNMLVSAGGRLMYFTVIAGNLAMTGGTFEVYDQHVVTVQGSANFSGGTFTGNHPGSAPQILDVAGDFLMGASCSNLSSDAWIYCGGNWSATAAFDPLAGWVRLDGAPAKIASGTLRFCNLEIRDGTKTFSSPAQLRGSLVVTSGTLDADTAITVNGAVTVQAGATFDTGVSTHRVAGDWTSTAAGAATTGTGTIEFTGNGTTSTSPNTIPNMLVSSGGRLMYVTTIAGNLAMTGGIFEVYDQHTVVVQGSASFTGGTFSGNYPYYGPQTLDVAGDFFMGASCSSLSGDAWIHCGGNWTATAAFDPLAGWVRLDGTAAKTASGTLKFCNLEIQNGVKTFSAPAQLRGSLVVTSGTLDADAAITVNGAVTVQAGATFDTGSSVHRVAGDWTSTAAGAATTGTGTIEFTGNGTTSTSPNTIPNMLVSGGGRLMYVTTIAGNLAMTGGSFAVYDQHTVVVQGSVSFTGGTLTGNFPYSGPQTLDVNGDVYMDTTVSGISPDTRVHCAGNWWSSAAFSPLTGTVRFDGPANATISGTPRLWSVEVAHTGSTTRQLLAPAVIGGDLTVTTGVLDLDAPISVGYSVVVSPPAGSSAVMDIGPHTHTVSRDWWSFAAGAVVMGTGTIEFTGNGLTQTSPNTIPNVRVSGGNRTMYVTTIAGNLDMTGGSFAIYDQHTVAVQGSLNFTGGTFTGNYPFSGPQTLDVSGDVYLDTAVSGISSDTRIHCAGNWWSSAAFSPLTGTVRFDGPANATISGTPRLWSVEVAHTGSTTRQLLAPAVIGGDLTVTTGVLDLDAPLSVGYSVVVSPPAGSSAVMDIGPHTHTVSRDWWSFAAGAAVMGTGTIEFTGNGLTQTSPNTIPNVRVSGGNRTMYVTTIAGNLDMTGGSFAVYDQHTVMVQGSVSFTGGTLTGGYAGSGPQILDISGDFHSEAQVSGLSADTIIRCAGNWAASTTFNLTAGTVELDGPSTTTISTLGPGQTLSFGALWLRPGVRAAGGDFTLATSGITIDPGATLDVGGRHIDMTTGAMSVNGVLSLGSGGQLALAAPVSITVNSGGTLNLLGAPSLPATIAGFAGGGYALTVNGNLAARHFRFSQVGTNGVVVGTSAVLAAPPNDLREGMFDTPRTTAGSTLLNIQRSAPTTLNCLAFAATNPPAGIYNVKCTGGSPISFAGWYGNFGGPTFENDPGNRLNWSTPLLSCPGGVAIGNTPGQCTATATWTEPSVAACGGVTLSSSHSPGQLFPVGQTTVVYTATDGNGTTSSCSFIVQVQDTEDPTIACPSDLTVSTAAGQCSATGIVLGIPTAADNCGVATVVSNAPGTFLLGTTLVTWLATDTSGRTATCIQTVTVVDSEPPTIAGCPDNLTVATALGQCSAVVSWTPPTATDNCTVASLTVTQPPGATFARGTTTVTYTACDGAGNHATCSFTVTVNDNEPPTITCPPDPPPVPGNASCQAPVPDFRPQAAVHDNCSGVVVSQNPAPNTMVGLGPHPVTLTATDVAGLTAACVVTLTVGGSTALGIACPPGQSLAVGSSCLADLPDYRALATVTGACGAYAIAQAPVPTTSVSNGPLTVTLTASDGSGASASCSFTVTVADTTPPVITCPEAITAGNSPGQCSTVVIYADPAVSDNCPGAGAVRLSGLASGSSFPVGTTVQTFLATDAAGNSATCSFSITVTDDESPSLAGCPGTISIEAGPAALSAVATWTPPMASDNCPVALTANHLPGETFPIGSTTVTYTATDPGGHSATCSFTVTVTGDWYPPQSLPTGAQIAGLLLLDLGSYDGLNALLPDGAVDIVVCDSVHDRALVYFNDGAGGFTATPPRQIFLGPGDEPVAVAGAAPPPPAQPLLVLAARGSSQVVVAQRDPVTLDFLETARHSLAPSLMRPRAIAVSDLDASGAPDIVIAAEGDALGLGRGLAVVLNGSLPAPLPVPGLLLGLLRDIALADLDHDGDLDLAAVHDTAAAPPGTPDVLLYANDGAGNLAPAATHLDAPGVATRICPSDLDGDGVLDALAVACDAPPVSIVALFRTIPGPCAGGLGSACFDPPIVLPSGPGPAAGIASADLRDDGVSLGLWPAMDLVVANGGATGVDDLTMHVGFDPATSTFREGVCTEDTGALPGPLALGDLSGDRLPDLVATDLATGNLILRLSRIRALSTCFGMGCPGTAGKVPQIELPLPRHGTLTHIRLTDARPWSSAILGVSGGPAKIELSPGPPPAQIYLSAPVYILTSFTNLSGAAQIPVAIPPAPTLAGSLLYAQWVVFDPQGAYGGMIAISPGLRLRIGY